MKILPRLAECQLCRDERAVAALELALVLPVFAAVLFGIIESGRYFWTASTLRHTVFEVGRMATVDSTFSATTVQDRLRAEIGEAATVAVTTETADGVVYWVIDVSQHHQLMVPFTPISSTTIAVHHRIPQMSG